jgi:hypothetical protein
VTGTSGTGPSSSGPRPGRGTWSSGPALRLHAAAVVGVSACVVATWIELSRALDGHQIAWVYSVEWPLFAIMGTYLWWKLLMDTVPSARPLTPAAPARDQTVVEDPGLAAWEEYLRRLQAADPPGGPS